MNIEGIIPIIGGAVAFLMAKGVIPISKDPAKGEQWLKQWGKLITWLGPFVVVFGILQLFRIL